METLDTNLTAFFQWLLRATLQGSLLVCLILAIKLVLRERLPARWHYCLWLVLLVRLSLPWAPQSRLSIYGLVPRSIPSYLASSGPADGARAQTEGATPEAAGRHDDTEAAPAPAGLPENEPAGAGASSQPVVASRQSNVTPAADYRPLVESVGNVLPWLWLAGCAALGGYILLRAFSLWRAVIAERPVTDQDILDLLEDCKMQMRVRTLVGIVITDKVQTPALFGFVRPRILLPQGLIETLSLDELHDVFLHELAHLSRHDIYLAWLVCLLQVLHWFNPLIWLAFRRMRADQEMAADALALAAAGTAESRRYGQTILRLVERFSRPQYLPSLAGILESPSRVERRIQMIARFKNNSYRWSPLAAALVIALGCASVPDARSGKAPQPAVISTSGEPHATPVAAEPNVFVDPNSGIRFTKVKALSGPSDVIEYSVGLSLSPNGKFLVSGVRAIPLDGSAPFDLVDMPDARGALCSPDCRKMAFNASGSLWVTETDPDSGRPTGSPRKLVDGGNSLRGMRWSPDSEKIIFGRRPTQPGDSAFGTAWTVAIAGGEPSQLADRFSFGLVSPDGKMVAASDSQGGVLNPTPDPLWVRPVAGGEPRKVNDDIRTKCVVWSANSEWLVVSNHNDDQGIRFIHMVDGRRVWVNTPGPSGSGLIDRSPQGRKLLFYQTPYDTRQMLKVVSVAGGSPAEIGWPHLSFEEWWAGYQMWAQDSRSLLVEGKRGEDQWGFWDVPLDGRDPRLLTIDTPMGKDAYMRLFSPDGSKLLLFMGGVTGDWDLWIVPVSLTQMKSSGPPVKAFGGMTPPARQVGYYADTWSPDGSRIAFIHNWDLWVAGADGKSVLQLTKTPEPEVWPVWSPDGTMIAFGALDALPPTARGGQLRVVPASGGEARLIADLHFEQFPLPGRPCAWLPNGKEVTIASESEGVIASYPLAGGTARIVARLKDLGVERAGWLSWSPDGRFLAFQSGSGRSYQKLHVYQPDGAKLQLLAEGDVAPYYWSPDSRWISYFSYQAVKTRPEGVIWEMDVEEAVTKLAK